VRLAGDGGFQVARRIANGQVGSGITDLLEIVKMPVGVAGLAIRRVAEQARDVGVAFDVRLLDEIEITPVRLRFAGECGLQVLVRLAAFQCCQVRITP